MNWQTAATTAAGVIITLLLTTAYTRYQAGEQAEVANAPAIIALNEEIALLNREIVDTKKELNALLVAFTEAEATARAERAALANQGNQLLEALLN